jgi:HemY protein
VTGALDAFSWRVPVAAVGEPAGALVRAKVEALVGLGAGAEPALADPAKTVPDAVTAEIITRPAAAPVEVPASATAPTRPAAEPAPASLRTPYAPVEPKPAATRSVPAVADRRPQTATSDDDDLRERIRLAAERAVAESSAPKTIVTKPGAPKTAPPKTAAPIVPPEKKLEAPGPRPRKAEEPKIFVPPRAPDDPGPEPAPADHAEDIAEFGPFRPTEAKA